MYGSSNASLHDTEEQPLLSSSERQRERSQRRSARLKRKLKTNATVLGKLFAGGASSDKNKKDMGKNKKDKAAKRDSGKLVQHQQGSFSKLSHADAIRQRLPNLQYSWLYSLLNPHSEQLHARIYKGFITSLILFDLLVFVMSTDERVSTKYNTVFYILEGLTSGVFLTEYIARLLTITERTKYYNYGAFRGRLYYAFTPAMLIDLFASIPFFIEWWTGFGLPRLTYLRIFRLLRILKTAPYIRALDAVYRVVYFNREILYVALLVCIFLVLVTAVLLYYFRPQGSDGVKNGNELNAFDSLAATLYWSTNMLTGQGGPDNAQDYPWYTKLIMLLTSVFSVAMFAIPASMLTWGFEAEAERLAKKQRQQAVARKKARNGEDNDEDDEQLYSDTDEEYFKIIAGADDEDGEEDEESAEESPFMKQLRESFEKADVDFDGTLTLEEFMSMQQALLNKQQQGDDTPDLGNANMNNIGNIGKGNRSTSKGNTYASNDKRLSSLEKQVHANTAKLDKILEMVTMLNKKASK